MSEHSIRVNGALGEFVNTVLLNYPLPWLENGLSQYIAQSIDGLSVGDNLLDCSSGYYNIGCFEYSEEGLYRQWHRLFYPIPTEANLNRVKNDLHLIKRVWAEYNQVLERLYTERFERIYTTLIIE